MAHVLLGFHNESISQLKSVQEKLADRHPGFKTYMSQAASRLCVSVSNAFAPVGDHFGLRDVWHAYCLKHNIKSLVKNYKDNRFNALFETSAATIYHYRSFLDILHGVKNPNKKLLALQRDLEDEELLSIIRGLGIMFIKITKPFWNLITSKLSYLHIQPIIKQLHHELNLLTQTPKSIVTATALPSLHNYTHQSNLDTILPATVGINQSLELVLTTLIHAFLTLMKRQLHTYITQTPSDEDTAATSFAPSTNLICERNFGDLDSSQHRRPSASIHHHTTVHLLKRSRKQLSKWMNAMPPCHQGSLFKKARKMGPELRKLHQSSCTTETLKSHEKVTKEKPCRSKRDELQNEESEEEEEDRGPINLTSGCWVAVAYPEGWYPGIIEGVVEGSNDMFDINFGHWCPNRKDLKWPDGKDQHHVHRHFIFYANFRPETQNCRTWSISHVYDVIHQAFEDFEKKYF